MWEAIDFKEVRTSLPAVERFVKELGSLYENGTISFATFSLPIQSAFDWYVSRGEFHEMGFFEHFWRKEGPSRIFPYELKNLNFFDRSIFSPSSPFLLGGNLAWKLSRGGAYQAFKRGGLEAKHLGEEAALEMLDGDFDNPFVFDCDATWSSFFLDVGWDYTNIIINPKERIVHILLATDTD